LRIVTYNFLGGGSARRSGQWARLLAQLAPDLVLAQECVRPPADLRRDGLLWARAGTRRWGTGLWLARGGIQPIAVRGFRGWVVGGELRQAASAGERPLRIFSIHCPAGDHGYLKAMGAILDRLAPLAEGADLMIGGDFNVVMGYRGPDERVRMSAGERRLLDRLTGELGLIPCWQAAHPGVPLAQTLRWTGDRRMPYHCDGIFVPRSWRPRLTGCEVVCGRAWRRLSDHNPVLAAFDGGHGFP
jgi:hypothetical protein